MSRKLPNRGEGVNILGATTNPYQSAHSYAFRPADAEEEVVVGLSKREYFAAAALRSILITSAASARSGHKGIGICAAAAVQYADALIEALNASSGIHEDLAP